MVAVAGDAFGTVSEKASRQVARGERGEKKKKGKAVCDRNARWKFAVAHLETSERAMKLSGGRAVPREARRSVEVGRRREAPILSL